MKKKASVIAIGTTRAPKIRAVSGALALLRRHFSGFLSGELLLELRDVPSRVPSTPSTTRQSMRGARNRALRAFELVRREGASPALSIGLEGGISSEEGAVFLESWAFATDCARGYYGGSGRLPLPEALAEAVLARGEDLGPAADRYFEREDVAGQEGTFGVLTHGIVTREEAFTRSILHALAPFYNAGVYSRKGGPV